MKDLPRVFPSLIDHEIDNLQRTYISSKNEVFVKRNIPNVTLNDIDKILNNRNHIYKTKVKITLKNNSVKVIDLISRSDKYLISINNEKILIDDISKIETI